MHISDGVLSGGMIASSYVAALSIIGLTIRKMEIKDMPKISVVTAVFFVASLIHIPLGPTSVHLILNGLVGVVLGAASFISIFIGLVLQCMLFQHGGITSLGWNACMMGIPALGAHLIFKSRKSKFSSFIFESTFGNKILCFVTFSVIAFSSLFCLGLVGVLISNSVSSPISVAKMLHAGDSFKKEALESGFKAKDIDAALLSGSDRAFGRNDEHIDRINKIARNASMYRVLYLCCVVGLVVGLVFLIVSLGLGTPDQPDRSRNIMYKLAYRVSHVSREYVFGFMGGSFAIFGTGVIMAIGLGSSNEAFLPIAKMAILAHVFIMIIEGIVVGFTAAFLAKIKPEIIGNNKKSE